MSIKIILFITFIFQTFTMQIPKKYLKTLSENEVSKEVEKKIIDAFLLLDMEDENNVRIYKRITQKP